MRVRASVVAGPSRRVMAAVAAETLVALGLALALLGRKSMWLDEAFTWSTVNRSFPDLVHLLITREGFQILHSLIMWPVNRLSSTPAMLRLPSALAFAATVPAVWLTGRRLFDDRAGLGAGLLLSVNAFALQFAQEARSYPLTMMLGAYSAAFLAGEVGAPTRRGRRLWITASVLTVYAHGYAVLVIGAQAASLLLLPRGPARRRLLRGAATIGLFMSPAVILALVHSGRADSGVWLTRPGLSTLKELIWYFSGRTFTAIPVYVVGGAVALVAATRSWRSRARSVAAWRYTMPVAWLVLPVAVPLAVSMVHPMWYFRYAMPTLAALVVLAGYGLTRLRKAVTLTLVLAVACALALRGVVRWYDDDVPAGSDPKKVHIEEIVDYLERHVEPGDGVVFLIDRTRFPFEFYARDTRIVRSAVPLFPAAPWGDYRTGDQPADAAVPSAAAIDRIAAVGPARVWVVGTQYDRGEVDALLNRLVVSYATQSHLRLSGDEELRLLERR